MIRFFIVQSIALLILFSGCRRIDKGAFVVSEVTDSSFVVTDVNLETVKPEVTVEPKTEPIILDNCLEPIDPAVEPSKLRLVLGDVEDESIDYLIDITLWSDIGDRVATKILSDLRNKPGFRVSSNYNPPKMYENIEKPFVTWKDCEGNPRYTNRLSSATQLEEIVLRNHYASSVMEGKAGKKQNKKHAASGTGGAIYDSGYIDAMKSWFREHVGEGKKIKLGWRRNGKGKLDILHRSSKEWTGPNVYGTDGEVSVSCESGITFDMKGKKVVLRDSRFNYCIRNEQVELSTLSTLDLASIDPLNTDTVGADDNAVGFIDPATAMTIFSIARFIWSAMHPELDLELPGSIILDVWLENDIVKMEFEESPYIRAVFIAEWHLGIKSIDVASDSVLVKFLPQPQYWWPINSRKFVIKHTSEMPSESAMESREFPVEPMESDVVHIPKPILRFCTHLFGSQWTERALGFTTGVHLTAVHRVHPAWLRVYTNRHDLNVIHGDCHEGRGAKWRNPPSVQSPTKQQSRPSHKVAMVSLSV